VRYLISFGLGFALAAGLWLATGWGSGRSPHGFADYAAVERWMAGYYLQPEPQRLAQAIDTLSVAGALADEARRKPAAAFFAALIAHDDGTLELLTQALAEAAPAKQHLIAEAIALSGLPEWRRRLTVLKRLVPARALHIDTLLAEPEAQPTLSLPFDTAGVVLDMVVAHFTATGSEEAARRVVAGLAGAVQDTDPAASSTRHGAKLALTQHAGSDPRLLAWCRREAEVQPEALAELLRDVIATAEARHAAGQPGSL
jgi:hypothetical protein